MPICFLVIASTVVIYGLGGRPWAKALDVTMTSAGEVGVSARQAGSAEAVRESLDRDPYSSAEPQALMRHVAGSPKHG